MPRTERPLDSEDTELGRFAADLRRLRDKAGRPSYRALASRAHYSAATLSDAAGGKKLPSLSVTLAYVTACGGDAQEWEQRWRDIAAPPAPSGDAPYVGLKAFQREDADRFYGREKLTAKLHDLVARHPFVGVFGASGSGKSSLLRAGLLPRLDQALIFTPGAQPLDECAVRLSQVTGSSAVVLRAELADPAALGLLCKQHDENLVLVIDQFEEVFTLCGQEQRDWFIKALTSAPHVVIGVRADFYGHVGRHSELVEALEGAQLLVGPMTADELRRAITEPARHVGATVESALVTRLVADVAGQAAALPLVQHALAETWHRRRGMTLSLTGYEEAGGVEHAVARTAEAVYSQLTEDEQRTARGIFLRLIALGEGTEDTKRRARREDLDAGVLEHLANARLVTLTEQHAELTHEALIRSWPRLRDWIAEDREALRVHHQLTEAAAAWGGDRDLLYRGVRLARAVELSPDSLTEPERAFLTASQAEGSRRTLRVRMVVSVLSVLVVLLAGSVFVAVDKAREASERRDVAIAAAAAAQARWLMHHDPPKAAAVAVAAHRVAPNEDNRNLLLSADAGTRRVALVHFRDGVNRRFSKVGGSNLFVGVGEPASDVRLYDVRERTSSKHAVLPAVPIAMSDDGRRAVLSIDNRVKLFDISDPAQPRLLAEAPGVLSPHLSASREADVLAGHLTDERGEEPRVLLFDGTGRLREIEVPRALGTVPYLTLSPDGRTLAMLRPGNNAVEILIFENGQFRRVSEFPMPNSYLKPSRFSPDGRLLVLTDGMNAVAEVWDVTDRANPVRSVELRAPARGEALVEFTPDSRRIAIGADRSVRVWELVGTGAAHETATFENFATKVTALGYWQETGDFFGLDGDHTVFPLRTDIGKVLAEHCGAGAAALSDDDWAKYFPDVERVPVC